MKTTTHTYPNAITVFMKTVVRERRIPFEIKASGKEQINRDAWAAFPVFRNGTPILAVCRDNVE